MNLHLTTDLMLVGKISSAARQQSCHYQNFSQPRKLLDQLQSEATVLVDLQMDGLNIADFVEHARQQASPVKIVAYAQHVRTELIKSAKDAGCDEVLTRGQFDRDFMAYLQ